MATKRELQTAFEKHYSQRTAKENAITPGQKKTLIEKLRQELAEQGRVPLPTGPVKLDVNHPVVKAAISGRSVTMSGKIVKKGENQTFSERMQNLSMPAKIAVMAAMTLLPCILAMTMSFLLDSPPPEIAVLPTETITPTVTSTVTPTASPAASPTQTAQPVPSPIIPNTPTPTDFIINNESIPAKSHDPASIEIAGLTYVLGTGQIKNGVWQPQAAEWLSGSDLRRVIAIPYDHQTVDILTSVPPGTKAFVRLRSGEIVEYKIEGTYRVQRQQIEILAEKKPSMVIILSGEDSIERTIIVGNAIQEQEDFSIYSVATNQGDSVVIPVSEPNIESPPTPVIITNITISNTTTTTTNTIPITE